MNKMVPPDILFISIKRKVEEFYDSVYFGVRCEARKRLHIQLLEKYYKKDMFSNSTTMRDDLDEFLTNLHEMVDSYFED